MSWIGKSGTRYSYYVYPRHPNINQGQDGNYIYAKKEPRRTLGAGLRGRGRSLKKSNGRSPSHQVH